jgi:E3 ubiquitin-protein ligase RBBP6
VLADSLIPNHTLRSTISNMLSTRAGSAISGTTKHRSSSGSNPDPKLQSHALSAASERVEMKQPMDHHISEAAASDGGLQVAVKDVLVNQPLEKLAANVDPLSKDEVSSAELSVEKASASAENRKVQDGSTSTLKVTTAPATLEQNATKTDQPKKKRKKAGSANIVQPNNVGFGYNMPIEPAYYNPFIGGCPWVTEPYMYGTMGMPYGGYPMGPYGVNPMNMPPQAPPLHGYPPNSHRCVLAALLIDTCNKR